MSNGNLQYVADTIAIESLASDLPIEKKAGLFDDLGFSGVASSITSKVKSLLVEDDSPMGWLKAIGNLLASGALFKLHPLLGITYVVANAIGVDVIGIGQKVLGGVYDAIKGGANVVMSDIDYQGKIAIGMYNKGLLKEAQLFGRKNKEIDIPFLPRKGSSKIERVFGNLFRVGKRGKMKTLVAAIVIWALKTALLGAGLVAGAGLITSFIKGDSKKKPEAEPETTPEAKPEKPTESEGSGLKQIIEDSKTTPTGLSPSGRGTDVYENDQSNHVWIVPIIGGLKETLAIWAGDIYPELSGYEDIIYSSPSFSEVLNKFKRNYDLGASSVRVPQEFSSRKQVVDTFAGDVSRKIKGMK